MNHKKAMPANGTRFSPMATAALRPESVSHVPATSRRGGAESLSIVRAVIRSTGKTIPATAAARGVLSELPACSGSWPVAVSVMGSPFRHPSGAAAAYGLRLECHGDRAAAPGHRPDVGIAAKIFPFMGDAIVVRLVDG